MSDETSVYVTDGRSTLQSIYHTSRQCAGNEATSTSVDSLDNARPCYSCADPSSAGFSGVTDNSLADRISRGEYPDWLSAIDYAHRQTKTHD